jgi:bis(5'-adenosyl)-triphosphatase
MEKFDFNDPDIQQRLVAANELAFAFLNKMPIVPGHILICPKRAVATSEELTFDEWKDLLSIKEIVCAKLRHVIQAKGFNFAWNEDLIAGQTVPHFHLHIVPRKENDAGIVEYEPRVFLYRPGSRADSPKEELRAFANELRTS